jgi:hypothetical protein
LRLKGELEEKSEHLHKIKSVLYQQEQQFNLDTWKDHTWTSSSVARVLYRSYVGVETDLTSLERDQLVVKLLAGAHKVNTSAPDLGLGCDCCH